MDRRLKQVGLEWYNASQMSVAIMEYITNILANLGVHPNDINFYKTPETTIRYYTLLEELKGKETPQLPSLFRDLEYWQSVAKDLMALYVEMGGKAIHLIRDTI